MGLATIQTRLRLIQTLNDAFAKATDLLVHISPGGPTDKEKLERLVRERDALGDRIDALLASGLKVITKEMEGPIASLEDSVTSLKAVKADMANVGAAIDLIAKIIELVAKVIALLA